jgi:hypothetical protein
MKKLSLLFVFIASCLSAQVHQGVWQFVTTAPSGSCSSFQDPQYVQGAGTLYTCQNGTWAQASGSGSAPAFNTITSGTNTTATMIVGTGASLSTSGSGTITATNGLTNGTAGLNVLYTGATSAEPGVNKLYVDGTSSTFLSSNAAVASATCGAATGTYGTTSGCDVFSLVPETFSANPFFTPSTLAVKKSVHLHLGAGNPNFGGNVSYLTNTQIVIPGFSTFEGMSLDGTTIQLGPAFPSGTPPPSTAPTFTTSASGSLTNGDSYITCQTYQTPNGETDCGPFGVVAASTGSVQSFIPSTPTTLGATPNTNAPCDGAGGPFANGTPCGYTNYTAVGKLATNNSAVAIGATSFAYTVTSGSNAFPNSGTVYVRTRTFAPFYGVPKVWAFTYNCGGACSGTFSGIAATGVGSVVAVIPAGSQIWTTTSEFLQGGLNGNGVATTNYIGNLTNTCNSCSISPYTNGLSGSTSAVTGEVVSASGGLTTYSGTLTQNVVETSVVISDGVTHTCTDVGLGVFGGTAASPVTHCTGGTVNYETGAYTVTFNTATASSTAVTAAYSPGHVVPTHNESGAVSRIGAGNGTLGVISFAARAQDLTIDCSISGSNYGLPYTLGVVNETAQEQSGYYRVKTTNCAAGAAYWNGASTQDSRLGDQFHTQGNSEDVNGVIYTITTTSAVTSGSTSLTISTPSPGGNGPLPAINSGNPACDDSQARCTAMIFVQNGSAIGLVMPITYTAANTTSVTGIPASGYGSITTTIPINSLAYVGTPSYTEIVRVENALGIRGIDDASIADNAVVGGPGPIVPVPVGLYILEGTENLAVSAANMTDGSNGLFTRIHFEGVTEGVRCAGCSAAFDSITGAATPINNKPPVTNLIHVTANSFDVSTRNLMNAQAAASCTNDCINLIVDDTTSNTINQALGANETGNLASYAVGGNGVTVQTTDPYTTNTANVYNAKIGFQIGGAAPSSHILTGNGTDYVDSQAGVVPRASTCTANADTVLSTDRAGYVSWSDASPCAVTLPSAASFGSNFVFVGCTIGTGTATITPTTSTISYTTGSAYTSAAASLALTTGQCAFVYSDNTNYFAIVRGAAGTAPSLDQVTGAAAQGTGTETLAGHNYTFAGIETTARVSPFVIQNTNSTNNNASNALIINGAGTSTGEVPLDVNSVSGTGDIQEWHSGETITNGTSSGGTLEASITATGQLKLGTAPTVNTPGTGFYLFGTPGTEPASIGYNVAGYVWDSTYNCVISWDAGSNMGCDVAANSTVTMTNKSIVGSPVIQAPLNAVGIFNPTALPVTTGLASVASFGTLSTNALGQIIGLPVGTTTAAMGTQATNAAINITGMYWNILNNKNYTGRCEIPVTLTSTATIAFSLASSGGGAPTSASISAQGAFGAAGVWADETALAQTTWAATKTATSAAAASTTVAKVWFHIQGSANSGGVLTLQTWDIAAAGTIQVLANAVCMVTQEN